MPPYALRELNFMLGFIMPREILSSNLIAPFTTKLNINNNVIFPKSSCYYNGNCFKACWKFLCFLCTRILLIFIIIIIMCSLFDQTQHIILLYFYVNYPVSSWPYLWEGVKVPVRNYYYPRNPEL